MGVSGGSVSNMILTLYGKPIHNAVATSAGLGVPITIAGTIGYMLAGLPHQALMPPLSIGFVSLIGFVLMAPVVELHRALRRAARARAVEAPARNRVRLFSAAGLRRALSSAWCLETRSVTDCRASSACRRAPPSFPAG